MDLLKKALTSRTVWTLIVAFVIGGIQALQPFLPPDLYFVVNSALLGLAAYFRINTKVQFPTPPTA